MKSEKKLKENSNQNVNVTEATFTQNNQSYSHLSKTNVQKKITVAQTVPIQTNQNINQSNLSGHYQQSLIFEETKSQHNLTIDTNADESQEKAIYCAHCDILDLNQDEGNNYDLIKKYFLKNIRSYAQLKCQFNEKTQHISEDKILKRARILCAYHYLMNKYFGIQYSKEQQKFIDAIFKNQTEKVSRMINSNENLLNFRTKGKNFPVLYLAAMSGHVQIVKIFIERISSLNFKGDSSTPVHIATCCGHYHVLKLLLSSGVPHNIRNEYGNLPFDQANDADVEDLLNAANNQFMKLSHRLIGQNLCSKVLNISSDDEIVVRKIFLNNYFKPFPEHVDAFHGTKFQNFQSIAKYGLKKPGTSAGNIKIQVQSDNIPQGQTFNGVENWAGNIFVSPSIHYANQYAGLYLDPLKNSTWKSIVQVKVKKEGFKQYDPTTGEYERVLDQPKDLEYKIDDGKDVTVVALMLVKRGWLGEFIQQKKTKDYRFTRSIILQSEEQKVLSSRSIILPAPANA